MDADGDLILPLWPEDKDTLAQNLAAITPELIARLEALESAYPDLAAVRRAKKQALPTAAMTTPDKVTPPEQMAPPAP